MIKRVLIDGFFISSNEIRGIGNVTINLLNELSKIKNNIEIFVLLPKSENIKSLEDSRIHFIQIPFFPKVLFPIWEQIFLPIVCFIYKVDILHCLGNSGPIFLSKKYKLIIGLNDLIFTSKKYRRSNKNFNQKVSAIYRNLVLNLLVQKKNTHFMCISKNTQSDLLNQHTNASIKTSVNYLGPSKMIDELISTAITKRKNILHLGALDPRKNTIFLIKVFLELCTNKQFHHKLVIPGLDKINNLNLENILHNNKYRDRVIFLGYVTDKSLKKLYLESDFFIFPSSYEGFGIPIIDSFHLSLPVLYAQNSSLKEIAKDAGLGFFTNNEESLAKGILTLSNSEVLKKRLIEKGHKEKIKFTWKNYALNSLEEYLK